MLYEYQVTESTPICQHASLRLPIPSACLVGGPYVNVDLLSTRIASDLDRWQAGGDTFDTKTSVSGRALPFSTPPPPHPRSF